MIFFWFGYGSTPVKYYGSCLSSPVSSNAIGILGILGILVAGCPAMAGLLGLTSSNPQANATSQAQKLQPIQPHPTAPQPAVAGLLGLTSSNPQANATSQAQKLQPPHHTLRPAADLPQPSADGSQRLGYAPPHNHAGKYMRKRLNHFSTPIQLKYNSIINP